jgi:RNA polymerase sigma-70 factor (ECF subfamily)
MMDSEEERDIFKARYEQFYPECLHIANVILRDANLAEDAVHEAFLSIINQRKKYLALPCRDFQKSIVIIVRNKCIDFLRKDGRMPELSIEDEILNTTADNRNTEDEVIKREDVQEANLYLNQLDEISRQIIYLKYIQGMSYREIGVAMSINEKTVEVRIARAKKKVRAMMAAEGGDANG